MSTLDQLDGATGCKEDDKMEVTISQDVNLPAEDTDLEEMRRQKQDLEKSLERMKADYQAEMERLELENQELKARALKEKEEREKYQELVKKRESEINELKEALKVTKVASEMLKIKVSPAESGNQGTRKLWFQKGTRTNVLSADERRRAIGSTIKQCGQWVHCRCEAKLDTSYRCPHCRNKDTGEAQ